MEKPSRLTKAIPLNSTSSRADQIPSSLLVSFLTPSLHLVRSVIPVADCSMEPTLTRYSGIELTQLADIHAVINGQIYYLVTHNLQGFLRRIFLDANEEYIRLCCDHPDKETYPATLQRTENIWAIFQVTSA